VDEPGAWREEEGLQLNAASVCSYFEGKGRRDPGEAKVGEKTTRRKRGREQGRDHLLPAAKLRCRRPEIATKQGTTFSRRKN